ncbi:TPA: hypothetical protein ACQTXZ_000045 [Pseudomonas aeruginosa]|uniref:sulfotransferase family protein n=2 Tax=Pseudomonas aeruginosa TaxID=287 RepID=UPI00071B7783|nr:sulfotransferase family protein [Pseudomonas aeruginosa]KSD29672.1 sulfotransferase family protein [Pseudomonas aeruginosa]RPW04963.1 sulfotransferase family protein [Pseudomonas aeruginosa]TEC54429.1 sulfotransferase family protein [Pseudomonas aeruginosa]HBO5728238.1 sulfotransferase family protein [Pseudomonas aeruginosa]
MNREVLSMTPRVVVILGMHRSGTSVLSAGLEALGVEFGENLIPPRPDNPKGYWEDARLVAFNDRVLSLCGFSSGDVGLSSRRVLGVERFEEIVRQAMALLTELLAGKALLGIKDPRMPRLMPVWQAAFDALGLWVDYVIAARHPLSVAESLAARDHLSREKSLMLWYEHSCRSMQWALRKGAVVVDYDRLLAMPRQELGRIGDRFSLPMDESACARFVGDVLDATLRHSSHDASELVAAGSFQALLEVHEALQQLAVDRFDIEEWKGLEREFSRAMPLLEYVGELDRQLWQSASSHNESMKRFSEQLADLTMNCTAQRQLNGELRERLLEAATRIEEQERAMRKLSRRLSARREELASVRRNLAETDNLLRCAQVDLDDTRARLMAILDSRFWRFTKPLRNLFRLFGSETGSP